MKKLSLITITLTLCLIISSCSSTSVKDDASTQKKESEKLEKMYQEIVDLSLINSESCTDPKKWDFAPIGSKACGGYTHYIAYSKSINTTQFLSKVTAYTEAQKAFNKKWNIFSTCDAILPPDASQGADGKPKFVYN